MTAAAPATGPPRPRSWGCREAPSSSLSTIAVATTSAGTDKWDPAQVAALTGPSFFATAIEGYYRTQYGVWNLETPERRHMVEPGALARVVDLGWPTAESENRLGKEDAPAKTGLSGSTVLAVVAAAVAIGAVAASWYASRGGGATSS